MKLALGMIVKNEVKDVKRILSAYRKYFDEVRITITSPEKRDELEKVCIKYGAVPSYFEWCNDFSAARNYNKSLIKSDYYLRLDSDDDIYNPEQLRKIAEEAHKGNISVVLGWYDYSKDEWGNTNAGHNRETIIKIDDNLYWNKTIHENILPKSMVNYYTWLVESERFHIKHLITHDHALKSLERNAKYLVAEYNRDKDKTDPRTIAYLGRMLFALKQFKPAMFFLQKHVEQSGWDEDKYITWCQISEIFRQECKFVEAESAAFEAMVERPDYPDAYLRLHDVYTDQEKWEKSIQWGNMGLSKPMPKNLMLVDPSSYTWRPALSMSFAHFKSGEYEKAYKLFKVAQKAAPTLPFIVDNAKMYEEAVEHHRYLKKFLWLFEYTREKDEAKALKLLETVPDAIEESTLVLKLRSQFLPPRIWKDKEITILCPTSTENWADGCEKTGIGGSEAAVIYSTRELTKLGYKVTVYNQCGDMEGIYNGVEYKRWYKFNPKDEFNIIIYWRNNLCLAGNNTIKAKKSIIWWHDFIFPETFEGKDYNKVDKVMVLSEFHKTQMPKDFPEDKIYVTSNGIVPADFRDLDKLKRNPHRLIWASSYDRGLEHLLKIFPDIRKEVPDAELCVFYGWNTFDALLKKGLVFKETKEHLVKLMNQPGVHEFGRIGHKELLQEYAKSTLWVYPCTYAGEINCIALTKAIACGCIGITNDFAVVGERNPHIVVKGKAEDEATMKEIKQKVIDNLKNPASFDTNLSNYIEQNSWETIVKDWTKELFV